MKAARGIKLVIQGGGAVGKTCLLMTYATNTFPVEYVPTAFENTVVNLTVGQHLIELALWDYAIREESGSLRPLSYVNANVFLACYSVDSRGIDALRNELVPEIKHHSYGCPILLVCTKIDLRDDPSASEQLHHQKNERPTMSTEEGFKLQKELKLDGFIECSALAKTNVKEVFDLAVQLSLNHIKKTETRASSRCYLL